MKKFKLLLLLPLFLIACSNEKAPKTLDHLELDTTNVCTNFGMPHMFSSYGLKVYGIYNDNSKIEIEDYIVDSSEYRFNQAGNYNIKVTYENLSTSYSVSVVPILKGVHILHGNYKSFFHVTEDFSCDGLYVYALYSDDKKVEITDYNLTTDYKKEKGSYTVNINGTYENEDYSLSYMVYVMENLEDYPIINSLDVKDKFGPVFSNGRFYALDLNENFDPNNLDIVVGHTNSEITKNNPVFFGTKNENISYDTSKLDTSKQGAYPVTAHYFEEYKIGENSFEKIELQTSFYVIVGDELNSLSYKSGRTKYQSIDDLNNNCDIILTVNLQSGNSFDIKATDISHNFYNLRIMCVNDVEFSCWMSTTSHTTKHLSITIPIEINPN